MDSRPSYQKALGAGKLGLQVHRLASESSQSDDSPADTDSARDAEIQERYAREYLHDKLKQVDPAAAEAIPIGNKKRVIRALEFFHVSGKRISDHNQEEREKRSPFNFRYFVLNLPRDILYSRIEERVDKMVEEGLFEETEKLIQMGVRYNMTAMQGLGYRQAYRYLTGLSDRETAISDIKKETRHFAKRQITWFKRERDVIWVNKDEYKGDADILDEMEKSFNLT
ncbi:MAG: hypothetical protein K6G83_01690 [Lachnospiraceae bacterium]|nr:hypothetical protein [Lachnospiraceae bacterium]